MCIVLYCRIRFQNWYILTDRGVITHRTDQCPKCLALSYINPSFCFVFLCSSSSAVAQVDNYCVTPVANPGPFHGTVAPCLLHRTLSYLFCQSAVFSGIYLKHSLLFVNKLLNSRPCVCIHILILCLSIRFIWFSYVFHCYFTLVSYLLCFVFDMILYD